MRVRVDTAARLTAVTQWRRGAILLRSPRPRVRSGAICSGLTLVALVTAVYHAWLIPGLITAGDFPYFTLTHLKEGLALPALWQSAAGTGAYDILSLPMFPVGFIQGLAAHAGVGWVVSERLFWVFPAVAVPCAATYALSLSLFQRHLAAFIAALAVVTNSYAYILYEGGQFGVAMGYGCMPLVLWAFARGQRRGSIGSYVLTGLCMALQAVYDIRSTYITLGVCLVYVLFYHGDYRGAARAGRRLPLGFLRPAGVLHLAFALLVLALIHAWWLFPALFVRAPALPSGYTDVVNLRALSLVNLSDGLASFHPFWFANDVRVAPINPLFFLIPLLVFAPLLWGRYDKATLYLSTLALIATFLVKGDNAPFGVVYDWLFVHLTGFSLFRDGSKFYQPLTLAYALLLGAAAERSWRAIKRAGAFRRTLQASIVLPFLALVILPASPAMLHQVRGTFGVNPLPPDYQRFNTLIDQQHDFFRVLWVPARPRFGASTQFHPALDADQGSPCCIKARTFPPGRPWAWLSTSTAAQTLRALGVRYIVVPDIVEGDVIGSPGAPTAAATAPRVVLASVRTFLPRLREFTIGHLHVFVEGAAAPLIYASLDDSPRVGATIDMCVMAGGGVSAVNSVLRSAAIVPVANSCTSGTSWYDVPIRASRQPFYIVLSQTYDSHWLAYLSSNGISPWLTFFATPLPAGDHRIANGYANTWLVRKSGAYHIILVYWPERLVLLGLLLTALAVLCYSIFVFRRRLRHGRVRSRETI